MRTWQSLAYLGLIPFVACLLVIELVPRHLALNSQQIFHFYSAVILCFLAGTLWKKDTTYQDSRNQLISNILCLYAFTCLFLPLNYALILLPVGYISLLIIEYKLCERKQRSFTKSYFQTRLTITTIVTILHGVAYLSWI